MQFIQCDGRLVCRFGPELNGASCEKFILELMEKVETALEKNPELELEFDLRETNYITSAFLRICIVHLKKMGRDKFHLSNLNETVRNSFTSSGLLEIMSLVSQRHFDLSG